MEKKPFLTESMAQDIIQDVPTPFHVYDEKGIRENARRINKAFSWNKGFREYFAVKALPNPVILQILKEEGCGVDCSSLTELMLSEVCGFSGSDIMFSSNQTPVEDMKKAYELGAYINLDDATMVDFLDRVAGVPENIFCRYNPGGTFQLGESKEGFQVMDKPGDAKYGMTEEQMIDSYKKLAARVPRTLASTPSWPPTPFPTPITLSWQASSSSWLSASRRPPVPISPTSTCPAASASRTAPSRLKTTSWPSARASARSLKKFWSPPAWAMSPSSPRWAASPPAPTALWWQLPSTRSTSIRNTSVWMPARPT